MTSNTRGATNWKGLAEKLWNNYSMIIVLIVLCVVLSFSSPYFLEVKNLINVLKQISIIAILSAGMTFVILSGGIDLSVGATLALSGVVSVLLSSSGVNPIIAMCTGAVVGLIAGLINGFFTAKAKLPAFIVTLGAFTYLRGLAYVISGGYPIMLESETFKFLGSGSIAGIPVPIYVMAIVYIFAFFVLRYTVFGRNVYAIGGNQEAAHLSGIKVSNHLVVVYAISGLLSGIGGLVMAGRLYSGQPTAGQGFELDAIAAVILGGTRLTGGLGTIQGTLIGALIMGVLSNGLTLMDVGYYWQLVVKGAVIVLAVLLDQVRRRS